MRMRFSSAFNVFDEPSTVIVLPIVSFFFVSTSLHASANRLHPAQYKIISIVATTGSTLEPLRQICLELGAPTVSNSIAKLLKTMRELLSNISANAFFIKNIDVFLRACIMK